MRKFQMYIKRGHLGLKGLPIMVNNELKALWSNKQIIYSSLISPILYFLFYSVGIQATFGDISFNGTTVSFLSYSLIGIFAMSLFKEMYQCVYRMITDKRWGLLSLKILNGIHPAIYILGIATFPIVGVVIQASILYILSFFVGGSFSFYRFCMIIVFLMISVLFWASILICVALLIKNYKQRDFVMDTLLVPILFAAPLFYSFDNAPFILKCISRINPLTYQVDAMRAIAFGIPDFTTICIVLVFTVVAYLFAIFLSLIHISEPTRPFAIFCLSNTNFKNDEH